MSMPQPPHRCRRWIRRDPNHTRRRLGVAVAAALLGPPLLPASVALAAADTEPPTTPGTPTVAEISTTDVTLVWTAATDDVGVTGYRNAGQCSGLQAGGEGPRWEGRQARAVP
ncbi:hypothetical protein [Solwaraspora sp. WMMD792]|uniref:hypothetical protein n=1 Tax=Solwaraspora sp. WMMD792 TaxID=3016099 RepID=UPI0024162649|nr:hypothetical protein [Solwaraspora sp. WMMD792]MDG4774562.1 hypothetical protein [Solwaraspora sp. WMMD792]